MMPSSPRRSLVAAALGLALSGASAAAGAASIIGGGPPGPGLGGDDLSELFYPNRNPTHDRHIVLVRETFDAVPASIPHEWGFYFASDPSTLYPIFSSSDAGPPEQLAVIDFDNGQVVDLDALAVDATFMPSLGAFGLYLRVEFNRGSPEIVFSQAALNPGGVDTFASFPFLANPLFRQVAFEIREQIYALEVIDGAIPIPEPTTALLIGAGVAFIAVRRRA